MNPIDPQTQTLAAKADAIPTSTVAYLMRGLPPNEEILLGPKAPTPKAVKRKIAGKLIGFGGDMEPEVDASPAHCAARELAEESSFRARPEDFDPVAHVLVKDENGPRLVLYYFLVREWTGEYGESREILDPCWFPASHLPSNILQADTLVLPRVLRGERLEGFVTYDRDMNVVDHDLRAVEAIV